MRRITKNIDRTLFDSEKGVASKGAPKNRGDKQLSYTVIIVIYPDSRTIIIGRQKNKLRGAKQPSLIPSLYVQSMDKNNTSLCGEFCNLMAVI